MKKLITGAVAALALLFGFASCSGDLHDVSSVDLSTLQVKGSIFTWDNNEAYKFTKSTDGSYYYDFIATASSATFAIDDTGADGKTTWLNTYRGTSTDELNKDFEKGPATSSLYVHNDADCMPIALEAGASYRISIKSGAGYIDCEVTKTVDAIPFKLVEADGTEFDLTAVSGTDYVYKWNETTAGVLKFNLKAGIANFAPTIDKELTTNVAVSDIDGLTEIASTYWSYQYKENVPYKLVASYDKTNGTVTIKVGYAFITSCDILSGSQFGDDKLSWIYTSEYALAKHEFTYDESKTNWGSATPFAVHDDGWGDKYCGEAKIELGNDFIELPNGGENANLAGLTNGGTYILSVKATEDKVFVKIEAK